MDNMMRIAAGLRLGVAICRPHRCCSCGADVDSLSTHDLSCRCSSGRHCGHAAVNDIVKTSLDSVRIPSHLEPSGLYQSDGRRPEMEHLLYPEGREGFSVGCNMPRHSGPIVPFNCNSRSSGQGSRALKADEVFSSRRLPLFRTHCNRNTWCNGTFIRLAPSSKNLLDAFIWLPRTIKPTIILFNIFQ